MITFTNYNKVWGTSFSNFPIFYTEADLLKAVAENNNGRDWRLMAYGGQSLVDLRLDFGKDKKSQPCFSYDRSDWFIEKEEKEWATKTPKRGYYLIDFKERFGELDYNSQDNCVKNLGLVFERTNTHIFAEALFTIFKLSGERVTAFKLSGKKIIANFWFHWTAEKTSIGAYVLLGGFDDRGLVVDSGILQFFSLVVGVSVCLQPREKEVSETD